MLAPQVLQALQKSSADALEACILGCPAGLQALVEVLRDPREEVRNEVILLLGQVSSACVDFFFGQLFRRCSRDTTRTASVDKIRVGQDMWPCLHDNGYWVTSADGDLSSIRCTTLRSLTGSYGAYFV